MIRVLLAMVVTAVLGRVLDPEEFGFFALVAATCTAASVLLDLGSGTMAAREIVRSPEREQPMIEGLMAWRLGCGSILAAVVIGLALFEESGAHRAVLLGVAVTLVLASSNALYVVFQVRQAHGGPALIGVLNQSLVLVGSVVFWAARVTGGAFAWLIVIRELVTIVLVRRLALKRLTFRPVPGFARRGLRRFYAMALVHGLAILSHTLYFHADVFMVRAMRGPTELGAYASVFRLVNPLLGVAGLLMVPLLPVFAAAAVKDRDRLTQQVTRAAWVLTGLAFMAAMAGSTLAPDIEWVVYGGRYSSGSLDSTMAMRWLSLALGAVLAGSAFITALQADRQERALLIIAVSGLLVNVVGNLWLLPSFGFTAAAAVTFATEILVAIAAALVFLISTSASLSFKPDRLLVLIPGVVMILAVSAFDAPTWRVTIGLIVCVIGAVAILRTPVGREYRESGRSGDAAA